MQCPGFGAPQPPFIFYNNYTGCPYPGNPGLWQQQWYSSNGCYMYDGQMIVPPPPPPPDTPPPPLPPDIPPGEDIDDTAAKPPLPPGHPPEIYHHQLEHGIHGFPPLIYDDAQNEITLADTFNFYTRYYAYQEHKRRNTAIDYTDHNRVVNTEDPIHEGLSKDLNNNRDEDLNGDAPLEMPKSNRKKLSDKYTHRASKLLARRKSKLKKMLKTKHCKKSEQPYKSNGKRNMDKNLRRKSLHLNKAR